MEIFQVHLTFIIYDTNYIGMPYRVATTTVQIVQDKLFMLIVILYLVRACPINDYTQKLKTVKLLQEFKQLINILM